MIDLRPVGVAAALMLCGCLRLPESYAPPAQRNFVNGRDPQPASMSVAMTDEDALAHFPEGVQKDLQGGTWRWTLAQPTLRILLVTTRDLKFFIDFTLWAEAMRQTGPVTLTFSVNGHMLDRVRYDKPGYHYYEKAVPAAWLNTSADTVATAEIDKLYVSPQDGLKFGYILTAMGFKR